MNGKTSSKKIAGIKPAPTPVDPLVTMTDPDTQWTTVAEEIHSTRSNRDLRLLRTRWLRDPFTSTQTRIGTHTMMELGTSQTGAPVLLLSERETHLVITAEDQIEEQTKYTYRGLVWLNEYRLLVSQALNTEGLNVALTGPLHYGTDAPHLPKGIGATVKEHLGNYKTIWNAFALTDHYDRETFDGYAMTVALMSLPSDVLRAKDITGLAVLLVGEENVRSDLIKALADSSLPWIHAAMILWDQSMPVDWLIMFLRHQDRLLAEKNELIVERDQHRTRRDWGTYHQIDRDITRYRTALEVSLVHQIDRYSPRAQTTDSTPLWLSALDRDSRARLLRRHPSLDDLRAIADTLTAHATDPAQALPEQDRPAPVTTARSWIDLERRLNIRAARTQDILAQHRRAELKREKAERAQWLDCPAGQNWLAQAEKKQAHKALEQQKAQARMLKQLQKHNALWSQAHERIMSHLQHHEHHLSYEVAMTRKQLTEWSRIMGNCINGYNPNTADTGVMLVAAWKDHRMVANFELILPRQDDAPLSLGQLEAPLRYHVDFDTHRRQIMQDLHPVLSAL